LEVSFGGEAAAGVAEGGGVRAEMVMHIVNERAALRQVRNGGRSDGRNGGVSDPAGSGSGRGRVVGVRVRAEGCVAKGGGEGRQ
jgi:hypothetical protein